MHNQQSKGSIPRWPLVKEVARTRQKPGYCPYGERKLIQLIKDRKIKGGQMRDNKDAWFVDRISLDAYMASQCLSDELEKKVIEFLERVQ